MPAMSPASRPTAMITSGLRRPAGIDDTFGHTSRRTSPISICSDQAALTSDECVLQAAIAAYLGRYRGQSRLHTGSDMKIYLTWCVCYDVQIAARRADPRTTMRYDRARKNLDRHLTASSPPTWRRVRSWPTRGTDR